MEYSILQEQAVLASVKMDSRIYDDIRLSPDDFYDQKHAELYRIMGNIIEDGNRVDEITLQEEINKCGSSLSMVYIIALEVPTAANIKHYANSVREMSKKRRLRVLSVKLSQAVNDSEASSAGIIELLEKEMTQIAGAGKQNYARIRDILHDAIGEIEKMYNAKGSYTGIQTGFTDLDDLTSGFQNGDLIIIGARPSIGKTAFALSMALNMTMRHGITVGFFACEMSKIAIGKRLIASEARLNMEHLRAGVMHERDFGRITVAANALYNAKMFIDDTPSIPLTEIKSKARQMKREDVQIIMIDYLALISHGSSKTAMHERVSEISKGLKNLARELDIPVIVLSQVGREAEGRMPTLANLRLSGAIEEDADVIIFLHREKQENETEVMIAKNRNGATDSFSLVFLPRYVRFENITRQEAG